MRPTYVALSCRSEFWREWLDEGDSLAIDEAEVRESEVRSAGDLGKIPLVVIRHRIGDRRFAESLNLPPDEVEKAWQGAQTRLAGLSKNGRLVLADKSGHNIMSDQPDLVAEQIRYVIAQIRTQPHPNL